MQILRGILAAAAFLATLGGQSFGAPVTAFEADVRHGDFGENPNQARIFETGTSLVQGRQQGNRDSDFFGFEGFRPGTEKVTFEFTNPGGEWGGLNLRLKTEPFKNKNDWWPLAAHYGLSNVTDGTPGTVSYVLHGHTGPLYAALDFFDADFRSGSGLSYRVITSGHPGAIAPTPAPGVPSVPVPPSLALTAAAIGALTFLRWRRTAT